MRKNHTIYYILTGVLLLTFLGSALYVGIYLLDAKSSKDRYDNLSALVEQNRQEATTPPTETLPPEEAQEGTEATTPVMLPEYAALYELNSDIVGWMVIEGTKINYPVMQTSESPDYYLKRNFDREKDAHGCLYAAEACDIDTPSDNVTIYGHHMNDGSMFGSLKKYAKQSYWEEHRIINFDTLWEHHSYEIFAVFRTSASKGAGFPYHQFVNAADREEFDEFIANCVALSLYDTGIRPEYGDKIICLSTCEYTQENGRFVVVAVRKD